MPAPDRRTMLESLRSGAARVLRSKVARVLRSRVARASRYLARVTGRMRRIRTPRQAWWFLAWLAAMALQRAALSGRGRRSGSPGASRTPLDPLEDAPLDAEIVALGIRARAVFAASRRVAHRLGDGHVDVVVSDAPLAGPRSGAPVVALSEAPPRLSVPAFDPRVDNPIGWDRDAGSVVGALGPLDLLPGGVVAHHAVRSDDREALRRIHHLEDVRAMHGGDLERAGTLARLAGAGVVVHLADGGPGLRAYLGPELHDLMTTGVRPGDLAARELLSIRMRRAALRDHSLGGRVRQLCEAVLPAPPLPPLVSVLMVTRRPAWLSAALSAVARQTYPRLELVLGLHGEGFTGVEPHVAGLGRLAKDVKVVRIDPRRSLGSALNAAAAASSGTLLAKMDDDEVYGAEHILDLVLAHEYSRAQLVGKGLQFVYLAGADRTVRFLQGRAETRWTTPGGHVAGGGLLLARDDLDRVGGWRDVPLGEDRALQEDLVSRGGSVYRTHGAGFMHVRHGRGHTWDVADEWFLLHAETVSTGWDPTLADVADVPPPPCVAGPADA